MPEHAMPPLSVRDCIAIRRGLLRNIMIYGGLTLVVAQWSFALQPVRTATTVAVLAESEILP
jgi:hypothetical protein